MNKKSLYRILLELSVFVCVIYTSVSVASFVFTRIPPYREGRCFHLLDGSGIQLKVLKNNILAGYSDLEAYTFLTPDWKIPVKASFAGIRNSGTKEVQCGFGATK